MAKYLVIRFSSIGDIVLASPVLRCLKQQTGAEIHLVTKKQFEPIVSENPYLDKVYLFMKNVDEVAAKLREENYDHIIDLHHNLRSAILKSKVRAPSSSFQKLNIRKFLLTRFKYNGMPGIHLVDRYFKAAKGLGVKNDGQGLDFFIPPSGEVNIAALPVDCSGGYIAFVIGAKFKTKQLPLHKMIAICKLISHPIILIGGKEDEAIASRVADAVGGSIFNACGKYDLWQSASLVKQADAVITHDTGMMHIAAAFHKKIISVWGNTVPAFGMYPYMPGEGSAIIEVKGLKCRPCSKIGYDKCPKRHFRCMEQIDEKSVVNALMPISQKAPLTR